MAVGNLGNSITTGVLKDVVEMMVSGLAARDDSDDLFVAFVEAAKAAGCLSRPVQDAVVAFQTKLAQRRRAG